MRCRLSMIYYFNTFPLLPFLFLYLFLFRVESYLTSSEYSISNEPCTTAVNGRIENVVVLLVLDSAENNRESRSHAANDGWPGFCHARKWKHASVFIVKKKKKSREKEESTPVPLSSPAQHTPQAFVSHLFFFLFSRAALDTRLGLKKLF